ncbi:MAG: tRNA1(Val) (adenine(37)-N6)-methyltransferase [Parasporobacterium sp.]|nr:tRNA1(Val) (adenine(37)-N6)-methyltransferase [Parasporobacterium sp.]
MTVPLLEDERIDDLDRNGYRIIQNKKSFCFGMDAVLLSAFTKARAEDRIIDLGTGTGIIPILLKARTGSSDITGLEIQPQSADMAGRSVALNGLENDIHIVEGDIKNVKELWPRGSFSVVTSNPPYIKPSGGLTNPSEAKAIARHEIMCTFDDVAAAAAYLLGDKGSFFLVHRPNRLVEIFETLKKHHLEPKRLKLVHSFIDSPATMFLLEACKDSGSYMTVEKPLIIYKEKDVYTEEIHEIYGF